MSLMFQLCYVITGLAGVSCLLHFFYKFVRDHSFVTVNCWFCNIDFRVPYKNKNEWFCQLCQQFNGFKEDGDYSRTLSQFYDESLNPKRLSKNSDMRVSQSSNGLCRICNANQEMKVRQLAMYVPYRDENYDEEIENFKRELENSYKLCNKCEKVVKKKLQVDANFSKLSQPLSNNVKYFNEVLKSCDNFTKVNRKKVWKLLLIVAVLLCVIIVLMMNADTTYDFTFKLSEFLPNILAQDEKASSSCILNLMLILLMALFAQSFFQSSPLIIAILSALFTFMVVDDLPWDLKAFTISILTIYISTKYLLKLFDAKNLKTTSKNKCHEENFQELDQEESSIISENEDSFSGLQYNVPLCGEFSGMNLGKRTKKKQPIQNPSYLFAPNSTLIRPSKLKLENYFFSKTDYTPLAPLKRPSSFQRSSPTVSSGYESSTTMTSSGWHHSKSKARVDSVADSVSEFDSISQVGTSHQHTNLSPIFKHLSGTPNVMTIDRFNQYEKSYGVSPIHSFPWSCSPSFSSTPNLSNNTSSVQINAFVPIFQTVLCSIGCFVLGFYFQIFFKQLYS